MSLLIAHHTVVHNIHIATIFQCISLSQCYLEYLQLNVLDHFKLQVMSYQWQ